jgi:hypothetical protein
MSSKIAPQSRQILLSPLTRFEHFGQIRMGRSFASWTVQRRLEQPSSYHQEQVAVPGLHVQHLDIGVIGGLHVEELAMRAGLTKQDDQPGTAKLRCSSA